MTNEQNNTAHLQDSHEKLWNDCHQKVLDLLAKRKLFAKVMRDDLDASAGDGLGRDVESGRTEVIIPPECFGQVYQAFLKVQGEIIALVQVMNQHAKMAGKDEWGFFEEDMHADLIEDWVDEYYDEEGGAK